MNWENETVKIRINIKGAGRRKNRITQIVYDYPQQEMSVEEFLTETVRQTVRDYNARGNSKMPGSEELFRLFSSADSGAGSSDSGAGSSDSGTGLSDSGAGSSAEPDACSGRDELQAVLEEKAQTGKVAYTAWQEEFQREKHRADEKKAVRDVLQAFEDGIIAVFVDGVRYTDTAQQLCLTPESEATFMRLTFLAGRIW